jgi:alkylation response protein AidB-like acyl-CoA dehydrogenase
MDEFLSPDLLGLRDTIAEVTRDQIAPRSAEVDRECRWPEHSLRALGEVGALGLHVPRRLGGHEGGLLALTVLSETIAQGCASSALCYSMHCVGTAVISAKATKRHEERYLTPIAEGLHITTLALSESGTGAHFYLPQTTVARTGNAFSVTGTKQFVTSGAHADSYVISTKAGTGEAHPGEFSCLVLDAETPGLEWLDPWAGLGMRGNASRPLRLRGVEVPAENLLGAEGDQIWYVFEVVAPYFLLAMAGTYLGVAQAALDETEAHVRERTYDHSGEALADLPVLQYKIAEMRTAVWRARGLIYHAAVLGDAGSGDALPTIMLAKAEAGETAVRVTNEAMTCCGGMAYRENGLLARLLRDARASHVMAPTTDVLRIWAARLLLGRPLL